MDYRKALPVLVALGAVPTLCSTALADTSGVFATPDSGAYVGAGWGQFNLHIDNLDDVGTAVSTIAHSNDNAWKAFVGYRFNPVIALEAAYIDLGHPGDRFSATGSDGNYRVRLTGWSPSLIGTIPLGPVEIFGKVGYYIYNVDLRAHFTDASLPDIDSSHSRSNFLYGGGLGLTFFGHLNARAEYERINLSHASSSNAMWLAASWRF